MPSSLLASPSSLGSATAPSIGDGHVAPEELRTWLEWAGMRLIALPGGRTGPRDRGTFWPDFSQDEWEVLQFRQGIPLRAAAPSPAEISLMEFILDFPSLCAHEPTRRVLHCRALIHPVKYRPLWRWQRIADLLEVKIYTVKAWHKAGLVEIARKLPTEAIERVEKAFR